MFRLASWALLLAAALVLAEGCEKNGRTYRHGDEWTENNAFVKRCQIRGDGSWLAEVVACLSPNGARILVGSELNEGQDKWRCETDASGRTALVHGANPNARCDGRPQGSRWQEKSFELECRPGGQRVLIACVSDGGERIPVNGTRVVNGFTMECVQYGNGTVLYRARP